MDDGSSDGSFKVAKNAAKDDPRIQVLTIPHTGYPGLVKNIGAQAGSKPWVTFLDSDDTLTPTALEEVFDRLEKSPQVKALYTLPGGADQGLVGPKGVEND